MGFGVAFECVLVIPCRVLKLQTVRLSPPTPMWFTGRWSWDAADDCSLVLALRCVWRSGCLGIDRILPGLALDSVTRPERTFEVFRETSPTDSHCCETGHRPSLRLHFGALVHCPARLTPSSSHGVGPRKPACTGTSAPRPSIDHSLAGRLSRGHRTRPLPDGKQASHPSASGYQSRSHVPSSWFRTTSTACSARGSRACCIPLPTMGFVSFPA